MPLFYVYTSPDLTGKHSSELGSHSRIIPKLKVESNLYQLIQFELQLQISEGGIVDHIGTG